MHKSILHFSVLHEINDVRIFHKEALSAFNSGFCVTILAIDNQIVQNEDVLFVKINRHKRNLKTISAAHLRIAAILIHKKADLYQFHDPELIIIGFLLRLLGRKVIYDVHEDLPKQIYHKNWIPTYIRSSLAFVVGCLEKIAYYTFSAIITADDLISTRFGKNAITIRNFPIVGERINIDLPARKRQKKMVYTGKLATKRGLFEMLELIYKLNEIHSVTLVLAGEFENHQTKIHAEQHLGWKYTNYLGKLDFSDMPSVLENATLGLALLHPSPQYLTAIPTKLFEYMQAGIPVVGSKFPSWEKIVDVERCGILVDPENITEILAAVLEIFNSFEKQELMSQNGINAMKEKYSWESEARKLTSLYVSLLK
jgi:glycosyltransferase involved in cell wall biosynthesis